MADAALQLDDFTTPLRASSMPLAFGCPGSVRRPSVPIREDSDAADLGTAFHEAIRSLVEGRGLDFDELGDVADRYHVEVGELRMLCAQGMKLWRQVRDSFPRATTEDAIEVSIDSCVDLSGHVDLVSVSGTVARIGDWKTGRKDTDYSEQMRAYGALVLLRYPLLTECTITVLWLRDGEIENYTMKREDAEAFRRRIHDEIVDWNGIYHPSPTRCLYCPRSHECDAANAMVRRDVAAIADKSLVGRVECEIGLMTPDEKIEVYEKATAVEVLAKRVRDAVKLDVIQNGEVSDGAKRLVIEEERRRELDPVKAWPVLEAAGFTDADFAATMTLGISKVEKLVRDRAGKGNGASAVRQIDAALEDAGAIGARVTEKLRVKRA